ncbi:type III pantothenate kinase [Advenella sp. RU8]|mgnify:CR=1 FL=1|uniref:type III pantothenate kinase n=1 Tax=Advenella sp. RU8 TaxID=3399575 RepID=UPI003AB0ACDE
MLMLLIDSGNTRIKITYLINQFRQTEDLLVLEHDQIEKLREWCNTLPEVPARAIGVNVAGEDIAHQIQQALPASCGLHWLAAQAQTLHLKNSYTNPAQLGADRWMGLLGLAEHRQHPELPAMLVSFGTATTVDTLDADNMFMGGLIFPGVMLMRASLHKGTANLPAIDLRKSEVPPAFPHSTEQAILSGIIAAQAGAIVRQWKAVLDKTKQQPKIFVTGGARHGVLPELLRLLNDIALLQGFDTITLQEIESPVLDGLRIYAQAEWNH